MSDCGLRLPDVAEIFLGEMLEIFISVYTNAVKKKTPAKEVGVPFLWGSWGIGKTLLASQIADNVFEETGIEMLVKVIHMPELLPEDLQIPTIEKDHRYVEMLVPKVFAELVNAEQPVLLLFDEMGAIDTEMQKRALQIIQERRIGEFELPDNCYIIATGNREDGLGKVYRFMKPLASRFDHYHVVADFDSWKVWATKNKVHPDVIAYLESNKANFHSTDTGLDQVVFRTPRNWVRVSNFLKDENDLTYEQLIIRISGSIGLGAATEFVAWREKRAQLVDVKDILEGRAVRYPKTPDQIVDLINNLVIEIRFLADDDNEMKLEECLENVFRYLTNEKFIASEYVALFYDKLLDVKTVVPILMLQKTFQHWRKQHNLLG